MMTRTELDTYRARLADAAHLHTGEAAGIAAELLDELERARMREALARVEHADLVAAARATLAAGDGRDCLTFLRHELDERGQLPEPGDTPGRILADAAALRPILTGEPTPVAPAPGRAVA